MDELGGHEDDAALEAHVDARLALGERQAFEDAPVLQHEHVGRGRRRQEGQQPQTQDTAHQFAYLRKAFSKDFQSLRLQPPKVRWKVRLTTSRSRSELCQASVFLR